MNSQKEKRIISTAVSESGMISGAIVTQGGALVLHGMSLGDISVEPGATLDINGTVNGVITNNGGKVRINGTARSVVVRGGSLAVSGTVDSVSGSGTITYQKGAVVGGKAVQ